MTDTTPTPSLTALDGVALIALTSRHASGCNGWEDADKDENDRDTIVLPASAGDDLPGVVAQWDTLWTRWPRTDHEPRPLVESLGGTWPPVPDGHDPVWDETWPGTLGELFAERDACMKARDAYAQGVEDVLMWARLELFRRAGAVMSNAYFSAGRELVHDFGCMCAHGSNETDTDGRIVLHVRADVVYAAPAALPTADVDALIAAAQQAGQVAYEQAAAKTPAVVSAQRYLDLKAPRFVTEQDKELTFPQWVAARHERADKIATAVMAGDWDMLDALHANVPAHDPSGARREALNRELTGSHITVLDPADARDLLTALVPQTY